MPIVIRRPRASAIWLATVRFQIRSYSRNSSGFNSPRSASGSAKGWPAGRIASCASWAFLTLVWYSRASLGRNSPPYCDSTSSRAASTATLARLVESVRMYVMWPFSYRLWATCIVRRAVKPSLRLASCCSVLVVNGGYGCDVYGLSSSVATWNSTRDSRSASCRAAASSSSSSPASLSKPGGRIKVFAGGNFAAVDRHQPGLERFAARFGERADQVPIRGRDERHPLPLALDDQPHRHALHAAGRQLRPHLAPQQRRNLVAIQPVDDPPGFLRPHQVVVDLARMRQRFLDGFLGDFVKYQAMHRHLGLEQLLQMPTDRFALAVFVGRQVEIAGALEQVL